MDDLESANISEVEDYESGKEKNGSFSWSDIGGKPVFMFQWPVEKGSLGGSYYNTEAEYVVSVGDIQKNVASFVVYLKQEVKVEDLKLYSFNFFIRNQNGTEIHLKGYQPTAAFKEEYARIVAENENLDPDHFYCTKDGFVWGLKVPGSINHAKEEIDFRSAYQHFGDWVSSGGGEHSEWYKDNQGHKNRINVGGNGNK